MVEVGSYSFDSKTFSWLLKRTSSEPEDLYGQV